MNNNTKQKLIRCISLALAAIFQIAVLVLPYIYLRQYIGHIQWIFELLSFIIVMRILRSDINPNYKIGWIVLLLLFPVFGAIIYIVYGRYHFSKKEIEITEDTALLCREATESRPYYNEEFDRLHPNASAQVKYLYNKAQAPIYKNSATKYFSLGDDAFPAMLRELSKAEHFIFMEYFIVEDGAMLDPILKILEEKANNGVEVRFMYDSFGSIFKAPVNFVAKLEKMGIKCFEFNSFRSILDNRYNNRDHRKICVIDGNVAFTGGINLADEYINIKKVYGHWKDNAIMIEGEAVWSLTVEFLGLWDASQHVPDEYSKYIPTKRFDFHDGFVLPYTDYPFDDEPVGKNVYMNIINRANKFVYIMTPYLIPDNALLNSLINAAKNGIDVRLVTPGIPDKKIVFMLTRSYYASLIHAGVKIYEYTPGFIHSKTFLSDDEIAVVGTINLDYRSLSHHYENAVWLYKTESVGEIKKDFEETFLKCHKVSYAEATTMTFAEKMLLPLLRLFAPLM